MIRKIGVIIILATGLGLLLYLKPWREESIQDPRIIDRLPSADFIGVMNSLEFAKEISDLINSNKIKYRQFLNYDFLLSQSRSLGINLQNPVYLFGYENGSWGCIIELNDESKIASRLAQNTSLTKLKSGGLNYLYYKEDKIYIFHEKQYLLLYQGDNFVNILSRVHKSNYGEVSSEWSNFLGKDNFKNKSLIISSNWKKLKQFGIEKASFSLESDSTHIKLKSYFKKISPFYLASKTGPSILKGVSPKGNYVNIHLNIDEFKNHKKDIFYVEIKNQFRKYGFPFDDFIESWQGDLSFFEGGTTSTTEFYKETELDDEFNPIMVEKERIVFVPMYSSLLTINDKFHPLYKKLCARGFITEDSQNMRFLTSPPLKKVMKKDRIMLFSGKKPNIDKEDKNEIQWWYNGTCYKLELEKISNDELFANLRFSIQTIAKQNTLVSR